MPHLEPSYLRYIFDGLEKGDLHPDNAAALPEGLTGLYEAAFEENKPARERQKLLETFAIWALLKKEVSAQFVAEILDVPTQETIDFIATYSNWFTSPESGKYQLYHERLKMYLLQKLSEQEIATLHNKLVSRLEQTLANQKQDEFELYGLEFLSVHYFTTAMLRGDGKKLIALSYDQNHWQRQIKLSKGFEWSKRMLNNMMLWASKYDEKEVIECALNKVDLYHQEQNDAPRIVELVAQNDIETAFQRIESFGGNDKEGLQRKFILYMLCLMELTLLGSKDKPFRKEAIEKLLKHLDDNLPVDHSVLNWNDFFPSYLMFQMACECSELKSEYLILYKYNNINRIGLDWIENIHKISCSGVKVLNEIISRIADSTVKDRFLSVVNNIGVSPSGKIILNETRFAGKEKESVHVLKSEGFISLKCEIDRIEDPYDRVLALIELGYKLFEMETEVDFNNYRIEIINTIDVIDQDDMILKSYSYSDLAGLLNKFSDVQGSIECLFNAMAVIPFINVFERHEAYIAISKEVIQEGKCYLLDFIHRHVLETAHELADDWFDYIGTTQEEMIKSVLFDLKRVCDFNKIEYIISNQNYLDKMALFNSFVFTPLSLFGDIENLKNCFLKSISDKVSLDEKIQNKNLKEIAYCFIAQEQFNKSISIATSISDPYMTTEVLFRIAVDKIKNDEIYFIDSLAKKIIFNDEKFEFYGKIVEHLISIEYDVNRIKNYLEKMCDLISTKLNSDNFLKKLIGFYEKIHEYTYAYNLSNKIWDVDDKRIYRNDILRNFGKNNNLVYAIEFAKKITDLTDKSIAIESIASELERQGRIEEALECAKDIDLEFTKSNVLKSISTFTSLQVNKVDLHYNLKEMLSFDSLKISAIKTIFGELSNRNFYLNDLNTLQLGLQKFALNQLFFENLSEEKIQRYNRTLNIQWAIDIKNQLRN